MAMDGKFDIIAHGCNCQATMGKGIALAVKRVFPEAWLADQATGAGGGGKLGTFSRAWTNLQNGKKLLVVNLYTQIFCGVSKREGDSPEDRQCAIAASSFALASLIQKNRKRAPWGARKPILGIPRIGAGWAGGDWEINRTLIGVALGGEAEIIEVYFPQERTETLISPGDGRVGG